MAYVVISVRKSSIVGPPQAIWTSPSIDLINTYILKGYTIGPILPSVDSWEYKQILYKPQLNELEQAQLRELKRQEAWSPESLAAGTADPALLAARSHFNASKTLGGTRKNKKHSKKTRSRRN